MQQDRRDRTAGGHFRGQLDLQLTGVIAGPPAGHGQRGVQRGEAFRFDARGGRQKLGHPLGLDLVATYRGHGEPGGQIRGSRVAH